MSRDVMRCQKMSEDVKRCQEMSKDAKGCQESDRWIPETNLIKRTLCKKYIVSEGPKEKTDLKFGLAEKFNKWRNLDNGVTLWHTTQSFCHKGSHFVTKVFIS